ncbi:hypothetical protein GGS21DRAFT_146322 [Xylaria nigripes]|nr:hypothetical protein GGS21DRAFT_146322 [Xylaria nigripes]
MGNKNKSVGKNALKTKKLDNSNNVPTTQADAVATSQLPSWPPFKPQLPVTQLVFEAPIPTLEDQIVVLRNFWPKSLCRDYLTFLGNLPLTTTPGRPKRGEATRVNDRFQINDAQFAQRLWLQTGLKEAVLESSVKHLWGGEVVGLNSNVRVYRYSKNQFFDCHYDDSNLVEVPSDEGPESIRAKTTWTALLYLTSSADGVIGGETVFYPHDRKSAKEELIIAPETGMLLLHKHGDNCLLALRLKVARSGFCVRIFVYAGEFESARADVKILRSRRRWPPVKACSKTTLHCNLCT